jgi:hypothetical protein
MIMYPLAFEKSKNDIKSEKNAKMGTRKLGMRNKE